MNRRSTFGRALAIGSLVLAMSACGGTQSAEPTTDPTPMDDRPAAIEGTELAGVEFDVRRDPG